MLLIISVTSAGVYVNSNEISLSCRPQGGLCGQRAAHLYTLTPCHPGWICVLYRQAAAKKEVTSIRSASSISVICERATAFALLLISRTYKDILQYSLTITSTWNRKVRILDAVRHSTACLMDTFETSLIQKVTVTKVDYTDELEGTVTIITASGKQVSAFFWGDKFNANEEAEVEFDALDYPLSWEVIFSENKEHKLGLEQASEEGSYYAYGQIVSINPIIADFGDIRLALGEWTHDERVIGEYIYWKIERLDIRRAHTT